MISTYANGKLQVWLTLLVICAVGLVLRAWNIEREALWGDEALTLLITQRPLQTLFFAPVDPTPGLYYALHKLVLGEAERIAILRSISLICGLLTIPATFALARACHGDARIAASLAAVSFPLIDYSQEARGYALLVLLITLSAAAFVEWVSNGHRRFLFAYAVTALLAFYTHPTALFWIGPSLLILMARSWPTRDRRPVRIVALVLILLAMPEVMRILAFDANSFSWLDRADPALVLATMGYAFLPLGLAEHATALASPLVSISTGAFFAVLAWRVWVNWPVLRAHFSAIPGAKFALMVLVTAPLAIWLASFVQPIFMPRTILFSIPAWLTLVSVWLTVERKPIRYAVATLFVTSLIATGTTRSKPDWRAVASKIASEAKLGDVILICPNWQAAAFRHAFKDRRAAVSLFARFNGSWIKLETGLGESRDWKQKYSQRLDVRMGDNKLEMEIERATRRWSISVGCQDQDRPHASTNAPSLSNPAGSPS